MAEKDKDQKPTFTRKNKMWASSKDYNTAYFNPSDSSGLGVTQIDPQTGKTVIGADNISEAFKKYYDRELKGSISPDVTSWLDSLDADTLYSILGQDSYWGKHDSWNLLGAGTPGSDFDTNSLLRDLNQLSDINSAFGGMPQAPDYSNIQSEAQAKIQAENDELFRLLDEESSSTKAMYEGQMKGLNDQYGNVSSNILSQNYQQNAALTDSVQSEMSKSRRNALEAGASAGMRLASNINTLMSTQNQQNANAMNTSNNLAQMMLQQRQAAQGLQGDYSNYMSNVGQQRRGIIGGSAERQENFANQRFNTEERVHGQKMNEWENKYNSAAGSNPLADYYRSHLTTSQYN